MRENFKEACEEVAAAVLDGGHLTLAVEEKVALAMYKIDETCALVDSHAEMDLEAEHEANVQLLLDRCVLLQHHFATIDDMEKIVDDLAVASRKLQERMDYVKKHAEPILHPTQLSSMLKRTLTLGRKKASPEGVAWEPVTFIPDVSASLRGLDKLMHGNDSNDELKAAFKTPSITEYQEDAI
ncbi:hypothetical protein SDRG_11012 [Saprolegnia diclina VS20]|uniref:Uncharacterized protein n=1 Tax=Saprolegnia diclina (strain VS20) TaxID=1156394 RepID=T0RGK3_SAPDV|nr:hypothetical protein SDRG_11012 [Saprolegnia diclina VS20]EQC31413.1 hypothetical protein SDRG_11012 [Saprolegnia diclina VS20]|eukprot:XP_008615254.1 hypothetical protein SDRG_11012 [Saprolegnia diclina VS20]